MKAADLPIQRPTTAKLLVIDAQGQISHVPRTRFVDYLHKGDLIVANDAATLPSSLHGRHEPTGLPIEARLAGRSSLDNQDVVRFSAVLFGAGDFRTRTEHRPPPPALSVGDRLLFGPLVAVMEKLLGHPRLALLRFDGEPDDIWAGLARHGRPIQYAHVATPLKLWDVWTPIAGIPAAFEPPSAGFALDWKLLADIRRRGARFATLTHAAGISSTGDDALDRLLPFPEPYRIPAPTAQAIAATHANGGRVIAIGTTVVRALEHAAIADGMVHSDDGLATQRIEPGTRLRVVDAILSGTHEAGSSHYQLLRAFTDDATLGRADRALEEHGYLTHEFGDSVLIERRACMPCSMDADQSKAHH